jgi:hypothetical protein
MWICWVLLLLVSDWNLVGILHTSIICWLFDQVTKKSNNELNKSFFFNVCHVLLKWYEYSYYKINLLFFRKLKIFGGFPKKALVSSHPPGALLGLFKLGYKAELCCISNRSSKMDPFRVILHYKSHPTFCTFFEGKKIRMKLQNFERIWFVIGSIIKFSGFEMRHLNLLWVERVPQQQQRTALQSF